MGYSNSTFINWIPQFTCKFYIIAVADAGYIELEQFRPSLDVFLGPFILENYETTVFINSMIVACFIKNPFDLSRMKAATKSASHADSYPPMVYPLLD